MNAIHYSLIETIRQWLMKAKLWYAILICYLFILGFLSLNPWLRPTSTNDVASPDKLSHAFAYGGLAIILFFCLSLSRYWNSRFRNYTWLLAFSIAVLFGIAIEVCQSLCTLNRTGSVEDALANAFGAGFGYVVYKLVTYLYANWQQKFGRTLKL